MKAYACCPICGYKLYKGESGSDVDILCPRCGKLVRVVITADEGEFMDELEEEPEPPEETSLDEDLDELEKSVAEYKKAKAEMQRLGFDDYDEYLDYLKFTQRKSARKKDLEM